MSRLAASRLKAGKKGALVSAGMHPRSAALPAELRQSTSPKKRRQTQGPHFCGPHISVGEDVD